MKVIFDASAKEVRIFNEDESEDMEYPTLYIYPDSDGKFIIELDGKIEMVTRNGRFNVNNLGGDRLEIETYE